MEQQAIDLYKAALEAFNDDRYAEAKRCLLELAAMGKAYADAYNMLGVISYDDGEYDEAKQHFREALNINPNYTEAGLNLSVVMIDTGEYPEGEVAFDRAHTASRRDEGEVDPYVKGRLANLHADLADVYHGMGLYEDSLCEYERALQLCPDFPDVNARKAVLLRDMGMYAEALEVFMGVLDGHPRYVEALVQCGITQFGMGRVDDARDSWVRALRLDPANSRANKYLKLSETTFSGMGAG